MDFIELQVSCNSEFREILIAEFGDLGFDSMMETEKGFNAYAEEEIFKEALIQPLKLKYGALAEFDYKSLIVKRINWNEEWEKNFNPVIIKDKCAIRASFHDPIPNVKYEIIINPKMSFGTGHHATTSLMIGFQLENDHTNCNVLDCGCGTGILSILAAKLNARSVTGFDIDEWAVQNAIENSAINGVVNNTYLNGKIEDLGISEKYDIVLANINKNILLEELPQYVNHLNMEGRLMLSGFYMNDLSEIKTKARANELKFVKSKELKDWAAALFIKQ
jgi:ribosomal protein L11 methyltransferase